MDWESPKQKLYNNIGVFSKTSFRYHSNDTKTLSILQRVTKSQKVHISIHDELQNFITSTSIVLGLLQKLSWCA